MDRKVSAAALILLVALGAGIVLAVLIQTQPSAPTSPIQYTYKIVKTYPHDSGAFTEGLLFDNSSLYESTGEIGTSTLRRVDLSSGEVQQQIKLGDDFFGEGLARVNNSLIQLTWQNHIGFIYNKENLELRGNFSYSTEGWGLTFDGKNLIMSDGSQSLYFLDPVTYQSVGQVSVQDGNTSVTNINELEYINGDVYANIWQTQKIAIINPQTGEVKGWIDLSGLYQQKSYGDVLNGIAYDNQNDRLFVTGKYWPSLFEIEILPK